MQPQQLHDTTPDAEAPERVDVLAEGPGARIERIVSLGHVTPAGEWYDQPRDEWVLLVSGRAELGFEDGSRVALGPGEHLLLRAHVRHRVEWTDPEQPSLWVAVHFDGGAG